MPMPWILSRHRRSALALLLIASFASIAAVTVALAASPITQPPTTPPAIPPAPTERAAVTHHYPAANEDWPRHADPAAIGYDPAAIERALERLAEMPTTAMMIIVDGKSLLEYGDLAHLSYLASVRKSILAMLYGIHIERGAIDLDATLADLGIDDHQSLTDDEKRATVRHIISARSGIYHPASNAGDNLADAPERGSQQPGAYYLYSNWDFNVAGTIFETTTGINLYDALDADLAQPLGMQDFNRARHRKSGNLRTSQHPAYHMHLSTRDMARIGYLMLRNGTWNDTQIISAEWVAEMTSLITRRSEMNPPNRRRGQFGYGYMWWVFDDQPEGSPFKGAYIGSGAYGQYILVMPALDLVAVHKTDPNDGTTSQAAFLRVVRDVIDGRQVH